MVLSEINTAISIAEKLKKIFKKPERTVASRFIQLFEQHGVHRNQIPNFFGHELTVAKVVDDQILLEHLTEDILNDACKIFAVRREWLDGVDSQIYPIHRFYKDPEECLKFCQNIKEHNEDRTNGILFFSDTERHIEDAVIILEEHIGEIGEKPIYRYHILGDWVFSYWKCRVYMAACIAIASKYNIYIHGRKVRYSKLEEYLEGFKFLGNYYDGLVNYSQIDHREDMTFSPKILFKGLEKKLYENEYDEAIYLWKELSEKGYMDDGISEDSVLKRQDNYEKFIKEYNA